MGGRIMVLLREMSVSAGDRYIWRVLHLGGL